MDTSTGESTLTSTWSSALSLITCGLTQEFRASADLILGQLDSLKSREDLPTSLISHVQAIEIAALGLKVVTSEWLDLLQCESREPQRVNLNSLTRQVLTVLQTANQGKLTFLYEFEPHLPPLFAAKSDLVQTVILLCWHAVRSMPHGGTIRLRTGCMNQGEAQGVGLSSAEEGAVWISVKDEGAGYPLEIKNQITQSLQNGDFESLRPIWGMPEIYDLSQRCGGLVKLETQIGKGSVLTLYFPASARRLTTLNRSGGGAGESADLILMVENEPLVQSVNRKMLEGAGFQVVQADHHHQALHLLQQHREEVKLILFNLVLPDAGSGSEMLNNLRQFNPSVKVLLTSGSTTDASFPDWLDAGGVDFLQKPYRRKELLAKVRALLDREREALTI